MEQLNRVKPSQTNCYMPSPCSYMSKVHFEMITCHIIMPVSITLDLVDSSDCPSSKRGMLRRPNIFSKIQCLAGSFLIFETQSLEALLFCSSSLSVLRGYYHFEVPFLPPMVRAFTPASIMCLQDKLLQTLPVLLCTTKSSFHKPHHEEQSNPALI